MLDKTLWEWGMRGVVGSQQRTQTTGEVVDKAFLLFDINRHQSMVWHQLWDVLARRHIRRRHARPLS